MGNTNSIDPINKNCPICLEEIINNEIILKCGHQMCSECLYNLLKITFIYKTDISCPLCRKNIKIKNIRKKYYISKIDPKHINRKDIINFKDLNVAKLILYGKNAFNIKLFIPMEKYNYNYKTIYIQTNEIKGMETKYTKFFYSKWNKKIFLKDNEIIGPFNVSIKGKIKPLIKWDIFLRGMLLNITGDIYRNISFVNEISFYIEEPSEIIIYNSYTGSYQKGGFNFLTRNKKIVWKAIFQPLFFKNISEICLVNRLIGIIILNN